MKNAHRGLIKAILVFIILACGTSLMISPYLTWVFSDTGYPCCSFFTTGWRMESTGSGYSNPVIIMYYDQPAFTGLWAFSMGLAAILFVLLWLLINKRVCLIISLAISCLATVTAWITFKSISAGWPDAGKGVFLFVGASTIMLITHIALLFFELRRTKVKQALTPPENLPQADHSSG